MAVVSYKDTWRYLQYLEMIIGIKRNIEIEQLKLLSDSWTGIIKRVIFLIYTVTFLFTLIPLNVVLELYRLQTYESNTIQFIHEAVFLSILSYTIITTTFLETNKFPKFIAEMELLDRYLDDDFKQQLYKEAQRNNCSSCVKFFLLFAITLGIGISLNFKNLDLYTFLYGVIFWCCDVECLLFTTALNDVLMRIEYGNSQLSALLAVGEGHSLCINAGAMRRALDDVNETCFRIVQMFAKVTDVCLALDEAFYLQVLLVFTTCFGTIFSSFGFIIFFASSKINIHLLAGYLLLWALHFTIGLFSMCTTSEKIGQRLIFTRTLGLKLILYKNIPPEMQLKLQDLCHLLSTSGVAEFKIARLFTLNTSLLVDFLSLITTNLIVTFQFYFMKNEN